MLYQNNVQDQFQVIDMTEVMLKKIGHMTLKEIVDKFGKNVTLDYLREIYGQP